MNIGLVASHAWPIPSLARTGDIFVLDLAYALQALGHTVSMFAPAGTAFPSIYPMPCSGGKERPGAVEAEMACASAFPEEIAGCDIVHDVSTGKSIATMRARAGLASCATLNGGPWRDRTPPANLIVHSRSQRYRVLRGATDFEGTLTPDMGGPPGHPVRDAHVVGGGIDTSVYCPTDYAKDGYILWLGRWHPAKGYDLAIRFAKVTGARLVMAGINPADATNDHERSCAMEACNLAQGVGNIDIQWLPGGMDGGHEAKKLELLRRAAVFLYPTRLQEPFGLQQPEAMACGTPVVGLRYGSVPEIVRDGVTGYVVSDDAAAIEGLASACANARALDPVACRAEAVARFDRSVMAQNYVAEYEAILGGASW